MKKVLTKNNNGFTIIEVLIVLAVAGLIMAVVLLAGTGLQRAQANNSAKTDATHIASAVSSWSSNNGGAIPTTSVNLDTIYGDSGSFSKLNAKGSESVITVITTSSISVTSGWYIASSVTTVSQLTAAYSSTWAVVVDTGVACNTGAAYGPSLTLNTGTSTQVVVLYTSQTAGVPNWNCLQAE